LAGFVSLPVAELNPFDGFAVITLGERILIVAKTKNQRDAPHFWLLSGETATSLGSLPVPLNNDRPTALALSDSSFAISTMSVLPAGSAAPAVTLLTTVTLKCRGVE